eukprot:PhM_4_TR7999/c0_g1_i1/m.63789
MSAEDQLLLAAQTIERAIDDEIDRIDTLGDDDLAAIRKKRMAQLQTMQKRKEDWLRKGHGVYHDIDDPAKFFEAARDHERVVCHFYRRATERCKIVDKHIEILAPKHWETYFIKVDAERVSCLAERFNVLMLPSVMLIEKGNTFHTIIGFDEMGGRDDFRTERLEELLGRYGMLNLNSMYSADQTHGDESD